MRWQPLLKKLLSVVCRRVTIVSAKCRAEQPLFREDFYESDGLLFCKYCSHSVDYERIDTIKDHQKSKKHAVYKEKFEKEKAKAESAGKRINQPLKQSTVTASFSKSSHDAREEFVLDFIKMCTQADIPLHKVSKMKPFVQKHCKQGGSLPQEATIRQVYIPRLFEQHVNNLKEMLKGKTLSIVVDETTDIRDKSILNVIALLEGKPVLLNSVSMEKCNHSTVSQAVIKTITDYGIEFGNVAAIVTDSAAYCKKAFNDVLSSLLPNALHVLCIAHILNLVGDCFLHNSIFDDLNFFVTMMKSALFKKPQRRTRFLQYLADYLPPNQVKLPPEPVKTRWGTWYRALAYHVDHLHVYEGFFRTEAAEGMAIERIKEILQSKERFSSLTLNMN